VTEEFYCHNGKHGTREDVVFVINGIPVLVIECKNATKDEAIALGVDQVRRYHAELQDYVIAHELLHFHAPNHGKLWKSLMRAHLGEYEQLEGELRRVAQSIAVQRTAFRRRADR
jgi:hypothetical protein